MIVEEKLGLLAVFDLQVSRPGCERIIECGIVGIGSGEFGIQIKRDIPRIVFVARADRVVGTDDVLIGGDAARGRRPEIRGKELVICGDGVVRLGGDRGDLGKFNGP